MGRTKRHRTRRKLEFYSKSLNHESSTIELNKFMKRNGFANETKLKLHNFEKTGRGVKSSKSFKENDTLISVPYNLMITCTTLEALNFAELLLPSSRLKIHDLLSLFLVIEKHKKSNSFWWSYVASLPAEPPWLPLLLPSERINTQLPADLRLRATKSRKLLEESFERLAASIRPGWTCQCCSKQLDCVLTFSSFTWGYILVNTRGVYVDPAIVSSTVSPSFRAFLSDQPSMALCPYLDMFNHSPDAYTQAELCYHPQGGLFFELRTLTKQGKNEQVFISYGSHDNATLLVEYGFFVRENKCDSVAFQCEELLRNFGLKMEQDQYKFIREHKLNENLAITKELGLSFNLKAFLFACFCENARDLASCIYADSYPENIKRKFEVMSRGFIEFKLKCCESELERFCKFDHQLVPRVVIDYIHYKIEYLRNFSIYV